MRTVYVYEIRRIGTADAYVGSTFHYKLRFRDHKAWLENNEHTSRHLQNCWNKYGKDAFIFSVLAQKDCQGDDERRLFELGWIRRQGTLNIMVPDETNCFFTFTPEQTAYISKKAYELWADPVWAAKCLKAIRETAARPESIEHLRQQSIRIATDPVIQKKWRATRATPEFKEKHRKSVNTEESKKLVAESSAERWQDPVYAEQTGAAISEAWTEQRRKEQSLRTSKMNAERKTQPPNLEAIAKMTATRRKQEAELDPAIREIRSAKISHTLLSKSPEEKARIYNSERSLKISLAQKNKTPEEKADISRRRLATRRTNAEAKKQLKRASPQ